MPQQWIKAFKFEWELPYNSWLLRLKRADLKPNVLEKPKIIGFEGRKVLKAKIKAISNNNLLEFTFDFDKGIRREINRFQFLEIILYIVFL